MQNWTEMHRDDFDRAEVPTLFDVEPAAALDLEGTLFAPVPVDLGGGYATELDQIACNICGSTQFPRLSLGHVALCTDSTACYVRAARARDAELAELFPECRPAPIPEPERAACLLCGDRESIKRILGQRRYDQTVTVVCDNRCNEQHEMSTTGGPGTGQPRRFLCSCGAVSKPFSTGAPIAAAAHRHAAVIARNVCGPR